MIALTVSLPLSREAVFVLNPFRFFICNTEPFFFIRLILLIVSFKPVDLTVPLKGQDMRCNPVEKPPVVRYDHCTPCKAQKSLLKGSESIYVKIVGRFVKQQDRSEERRVGKERKG